MLSRCRAHGALFQKTHSAADSARKSDGMRRSGKAGNKFELKFGACDGMPAGFNRELSFF